MGTEEDLKELDTLLERSRDLGTDERIAAIEEVLEFVAGIEAPRDEVEPRLARALGDLGHLHLKRGEYETSLRHSRNALELCRFHELDELSVETLITIGWNHLRMANFAGALKSYRSGLEIAERLGTPALIGRVQNCLCVLLLEMEDYEGAATAGRHAVELGRVAEDPGSQASSLNSLAAALMRSGKLDEAEECVRQSIEAMGRVGDSPRENAYQFATWAEILYLRGDLDAAEEKLGEALPRFTEAGDSFGVAVTEMHHGRVLVAKGELDKGILRLTRALEIGIQRDMQGLAVECHQYLYGAYKDACDMERALEHLEAHHLLNKTLFTAQADRRLRALQAEHDVETARQQAEIHRLRTEELEETVKELEETKAALEVRMRELRKLNLKIRELSVRDGLTGLYNRRHLDAFLSAVFREAERYFRPLTIGIFDIDDFKQINDCFTHKIGDEVLKKVAEIFREECRASDCVARYGGEEFVIVLPETAVTESLNAAERIRKRIAERDWSGLHPELRVTVSGGLAGFHREETHHEQLLQSADDCLYQAKREGKNRIVMTRPDPEGPVTLPRTAEAPSASV